MPPVEKSNTTSRYWRSLGELDGTPEFRAFMEAEFPAADDPSGLTRRRWLQLMGASLALAGVSGCRWEKEEIRPFAKRPDGRTPGVPEHYATSMDLGGSVLGLSVTSYDGRPIKAEGNPRHPSSLGGTDVWSQAAILGLYDPDRSAAVIETAGGKQIVHPSWEKYDAFAQEHFGKQRTTGGEGLRVLAEAGSSPTLARLRAKLLETYPKAKWYEYEPIAGEGGRAAKRLSLDKARVIVCLDADLFGVHPARVRLTRDFAAGRRPEAASMNRLYAVESCFTTTGSMADHRLPLRSGQVEAFAAELHRLVAAIDGGAEAGKVAEGVPEGVGKFLLAVAKDLAANRGKSVVVAGAGQPPAVHQWADSLNALLGNTDKTVFEPAATPVEGPSHREAIKALAAEMNSGKVDTLLILGGNPVYNAPVNVQFAAGLAKVATSIRLGLYVDETSQACTWHLPQAHFLEAWGDARGQDGTYSVAQPLIEPLWNGRSAVEIVARLAGGETTEPMKLVRATFDEIAGSKASEKTWRKTLHDGLLDGSRASAKPDRAKPSPPEARPATDLAPEWSADDLEIVFHADASLYDGRFANNGWLQEMPDPMTKLTWDNAAVMGPATADRLGVAHGDVVALKYKNRELELPVMVVPGQAAGSVAVALGYGRTAAGQVGGSQADGVAPVGANAYAIRTTDAMDFDRGLSVQPSGRKHALATTQEHWAIDTVGMNERERRVGELIREVSVARCEEYAKMPAEEREHVDITGHESHHPPLESLWKEHEFPDQHRWGMSVDLNKCIGCNACTIACQAENNVPIVGRERVLKSREMHWIRIDRYFQGEPESDQLRAVHQPVMCQQCEMAPCEQVCPVAATVHSKEGLNDMVYNRCVGTRYCANNCPYKVRRFNFFNYHKELEKPGTEVLKMMYNPDVTVRSRGVMEKCTYCVQRIQAAKIESKNRGEAVRDGQIRTACQQACPAQAIEFGDLADKDSKVRRAHGDARAYGMLVELNVKPRTAYLARIRNPNPELEAETEHKAESGERKAGHAEHEAES